MLFGKNESHGCTIGKRNEDEIFVVCSLCFSSRSSYHPFP